MSRDLILVFSNPVEGREDEYNDWYDGVHLADVARVPGVRSASRFEYQPTSFGNATPAPTAHRYLAVFEVDGDGEDVLAEMGRRAGSAEMVRSDAFDLENSLTCIWKRRTP